MEYLSPGSTGASDESKAESEEDAPQEDEVHMEGTGCVFCDRIRQPESRDRSSLILLRAEHNFVILNLYPYNSGHLMVVPYEHTADLTGMDAETLGEMMAIVQRMLRVIDAEYGPQGYNLGWNLGRVAGAGVVDHVHLHVVPRWAGDTNFMPVLADVKVLPEHLVETRRKLAELWPG